MKKLTLILFLISSYLLTNAQNQIGLNIGYSRAGLLITNYEGNKPTNFVTIGIPFNFTLNKSLAIRFSPSFIRYGERSEYNEGDPINDVETDGYVHFNTISTPIELRWKYAENDKLVASLNIGIGHNVILNGKGDLVVYQKDFWTQVVSSERIQDDVKFGVDGRQRHSMFGIVGMDLGYKINTDFTVNLNFSYSIGLTELVIGDESNLDSFLATTFSVQFLRSLK